MLVQRDDGTHTANAGWEIPIYKMHEMGTQFEASFGEHIPALVDEMSGEKLKNACKKVKSTSAPGADGWRVVELQALPLHLLEK